MLSTVDGFDMAQAQLKLLITDTDSRVLQLLESMLVKYTYEVTTENDVLRILSLLRSQRYDFVLLDVTIPYLNAPEIIDSIMAANINTAIVSASDIIHYDSAIETVRRGAFELLVKPYDIKLLPALIDHAIRDSVEQSQQENYSTQGRLSSDIYQFMIENSQDIQYLLDQNEHFVFINKRVETLLGYRRADLIGRHYSALVCEDDLADLELRFHHAGRSYFSSRSVELRFNYKKHNAGSRYFDVKLMWLPGEGSATRPVPTIEQKTPLDTAVVFAVAHDITARKKVEQAVHQKASYDYLTGLPNKFLFYDRLNLAIAQARRDGSIFAVMFLDLDGFKNINDGYGHAAGDKALLAVSSRLRECLREGDTLARIGGDEFIFLLPRVKNKWEAAIIAKKITTVVNKPFSIDDNRYQLSVSVGIALYPEDGITSESLIHGADQAMYQIKHGEKNGYQFYSA